MGREISGGIFSHGAFGYYQSNTSTYMELASHGYVVASLGHPYHALFTKDTDGKLILSDMEFMQGIQKINGTGASEEEICALTGDTKLFERTYDDPAVTHAKIMLFCFSPLISLGCGEILEKCCLVFPESGEKVLGSVPRAEEILEGWNRGVKLCIISQRNLYTAFWIKPSVVSN